MRLHLPRIGLYYPYIHFRDERWLKVAALYWPRMARIVPPGYRTRDSGLVRALDDELGFVIDLSPDEAALQTVAASFAELINSSNEQVRRLWAFPPNWETMVPNFDADRLAGGGMLAPRPYYGPHGNEPPSWFAAVHVTEIAPSLRTLLIDNRLAAPGISDEWLVMQPQIAWYYKCQLTEEVARRNQLAATTDQVEAHAAVSGLTATELMIRDSGEQSREDAPTMFALLSLSAVVPENLDTIPIEKIISIRKRFSGQFDRWREYADGVGSALAEQLSEVQSATVHETYLHEAVNRYSTRVVHELRNGMADLGVETADLAINNKFELPAGLAAAGLVAQPQLAVAAGAAIGLMGLRRTVRTKAQAKLRAPVAYLLSVEEALAPASWLERVLTMMRRITGLRG